MGNPGVTLKGLENPEYRGYDSAGMATLSGDQVWLRKDVGWVADVASFRSREQAGGQRREAIRWLNRELLLT